MFPKALLRGETFAKCPFYDLRKGVKSGLGTWEPKGEGTLHTFIVLAVDCKVLYGRVCYEHWVLGELSYMCHSMSNNMGVGLNPLVVD